MKKVAFLAGILAVVALDAATIEQVIVRQQWPWSTIVKVEYKLSGVTSPVDISVAAYNGDEPLASANLDAEAEPLRREAKRAQIWLEKQDGLTADLDMVRAGIIERILILQNTIARHGGVTPPAAPAR